MKNNTLDFYNNNSEQYYESTVKVDLSNIYSKFTDKLPKEGHILDLGCGSGRDSLYFKNAGYKITAVDGSKNLAALASKLIEQEVIVTRFEDINLTEKYDGIWACSSLLHLNEVELEKLLLKLEEALEDKGILYMSFKYGNKEYIDDKGRYFNCYTEETMKELINRYPSIEISEVFKTIDVIPGREDVIWLNVICTKERI